MLGFLCQPNLHELFLTYDDLQDDPAGTIRRMADLMGVSLTEAQAQRVQYLSSFEHMKAIDHKFYAGEVSPFAGPGGSMIRSGKKGNSAEMLAPAQPAHIDAWCKAGLAELGSDFPYERYFGSVRRSSGHPVTATTAAAFRAEGQSVVPRRARSRSINACLRSRPQR